MARNNKLAQQLVALLLNGLIFSLYGGENSTPQTVTESKGTRSADLEF